MTELKDMNLMSLARKDNKYLGSEELPQNKDLIATIKEIKIEEVTNPKNNKATSKATVYFVEDIKPMVANKTNLTAIHRATKAEIVGEAAGHKIALYRDPTIKFGGKTTGGIRISPYPVDSEEYKRDLQSRDEQYGRQKPVACENCGKEIYGAGGKTAYEVVEIGKKQFGKALCVECMKKVKAGDK